MFNKRLSQRDYWSSKALLRSDVTSAMGRREFETIKSNIKFHKPDDEYAKDKWRSNFCGNNCVIVFLFSKLKIADANIKFHKPDDEYAKDKAWRVRQIMNIFNQNIKTFGYFCTALSIDEMMINFYGKISFKQFIRGKPIRFGIKKWALCGSNCYLFRIDIYCGRNEKVDLLPKID